MKNFILFTLLITFSAFAQEKWSTDSGQVSFEASIPSFEEVKAINNNVNCDFNSESGQLTTLLLIKEFQFKINLMQEHFNSNYLHSDKHPKAIFKGKVENFKNEELTSIFKEYAVKGKIQIHGKTKEITCLAKIKKTDKGIEMMMDYDLDVSDFNVKIPFLVRNKVSNQVKVSNYFTLD